MPEAEDPALSLAEWLVLCLVCEMPRHGFALATLLGSDGDLGRVWRIPKPVIYRALQRLELLGLVKTAEQQASSQGPVRSLVDATPAGRTVTSAWLTDPLSTTGTSGRSCSSSSHYSTAPGRIRSGCSRLSASNSSRSSKD
jgi:DNA-binding PadR family transcriptional regulator